MALKDILIHVDNSKNCAQRLSVAARFAAEHGAHLTGLYVMTYPEVPQFIQVQIGQDVIEVQRKAVRAAAADAEEAFRKAVDAAGVKSEWRSVEGDAFDAITTHSRYTDLVVLGQFDEDDDGMVVGAGELADRLVLSTGRPILMVPYAGKFDKVGRHIMIAWDAGRLAARAVNDAMPLLEKAKKVEVLAVNPKNGDGGHGDMPGADICLHLARHGVNAQAQHIVASDMDPGNMLLSRISDEGVDMLVMGAYGHRRLRELVLGGVTRHILRHMTVPVLLSH
ncbi:MAG: universal stress protein [Rhodospirillales bacterium]|nr:universal stress protein [Rhodospirillales bacterium]MCW8861788.1 universal stress protein [Rhodospirillales bacterium]MCW8951828.1 universal stress protein [Rhodospirillales bacterium]MCW8971436.1 universal stress protein [Rhodospirillales bacterium]MCW9002292.1 universal stress protein [Rhodospirillales bacterium]